MSSNRLMGRVLASVALLALAACGAGGKQQQQAAQGPAPVGYVVANEQPVTLTTELPGRTAAFETSDVRPQVNGLITQQSAMLSFLDDFKLMMLVTLVSVPVIFLLRRPKVVAKPDPAHAIAE